MLFPTRGARTSPNVVTNITEESFPWCNLESVGNLYGL
jgi:hypothetical protein